MNKEFKYVPITELLETIIDNRGKTVPTSDNGIPLIATNCIKHSSIYPTLEKVRYVNKEIHSNWFRAHLEPNDILFVNKGTPGRVCLVPNPVSFCAAQDMMAFRCNHNLINYKYLFAALRSEEIQKKIANNHVGLVIPHLRKQDLSSILIPFKNKKEQDFIGNTYMSISEKIELNNKINAELEAMAKTLYDYWFVQFDFPSPLTPKGGMQPYKSSGGKMIWNEELKREIPEGWEVGTIGDYCKSTGGFAFKSSWWSDKGLAVVKIKDIQEDNTISLNDISYANIPSDKIGVNFLAKPGNVLIAMTGATVGKFAIVPFTNEPLFVNQRVGYFNLGENPIDKLPFLINSLNQKYFREAIFTLASGAAQPNISNEQINNIPLILPKIDLILNFNSSLSSSYSKILNNQKENQELASLRDWLLPMLMNGQVSVASTSSTTQDGYGVEEKELGMVAEGGSDYIK